MPGVSSGERPGQLRSIQSAPECVRICIGHHNNAATFNMQSLRMVEQSGPGGGEAAPRLVVVDVDVGTDDAMALLLLLAADSAREIKLLAVTCVAGNTHLAAVCRNTLRLLRAANRLDIPVFAGAEAPFVSERPIRNSYHGLDGFGDLKHDDDEGLDGLLQEENAVVALNRIVCQHKGEVTLVCLAPLTNIALAMRTFPDFRRSLRDIHIMGGNVRGIGNTIPTAEFNFGMDPESAHVVLEGAACPVQLTPWETCMDQPLSMDWRLDTLAARGGAAMALVTAADREVLRGVWVCCDQVTVAALLRPALVRRDHVRHVSVELAGTRTRGQLVPTCRLRGPCPSACAPDCPGPGEDSGVRPGPVRILDEYDVEAFKDLLLWAADRLTKP